MIYKLTPTTPRCAFCGDADGLHDFRCYVCQKHLCDKHAEIYWQVLGAFLCPDCRKSGAGVAAEPIAQ